MGMAEIDIQLRKAGLYAHALIIGFVHDAVLLEVRDEYIDEVTGIVRQAMEHPPLHRLGVEIPIPLVVDIEVKQTW